MCTVLLAGSTQHAVNGTADDSPEEDDVIDVAPARNQAASLTAEQGLKHLLLTVDVERLYRQVSHAC